MKWKSNARHWKVGLKGGSKKWSTCWATCTCCSETAESGQENYQPPLFNWVMIVERQMLVYGNCIINRKYNCGDRWIKDVYGGNYAFCMLFEYTRSHKRRRKPELLKERPSHLRIILQSVQKMTKDIIQQIEVTHSFWIFCSLFCQLWNFGYRLLSNSKRWMQSTSGEIIVLQLCLNWWMKTFIKNVPCVQYMKCNEICSEHDAELLILHVSLNFYFLLHQYFSRIEE